MKGGDHRSKEFRRKRTPSGYRKPRGLAAGTSCRHQGVAAVVQEVDRARGTLRIMRMDGERLTVPEGDVVHVE